MRLQEALAELKSHPNTHVMWRPDEIVAYGFEPSFSDGLSLWYLAKHLKELRKHLEELRAQFQTEDGFQVPLVDVIGRGVDTFTVDDIESDEWVVRPLAEARAAGYTNETHDPATCAECARERARERGSAN